TPPTLRRLCSSCIVSADITALRVILVDASRGDRAGLFRADFGLCRMLGVITFHLPPYIIIPAAHLDDAVDAVERVALRRGVSHRARRVELLHKILHRAGDVAGLGCGLHGEFFVRHAPDADARVIAVTANLAFPLAQIFLVAAEQTALVHDD